MTATMALAALLPADGNTDWAGAACHGDAHPDRWFPDPSQDFDYAAKICSRCPLTAECGDYAASTGQTGVWGGREYQRGKRIR